MVQAKEDASVERIRNEIDQEFQQKIVDLQVSTRPTSNPQPHLADFYSRNKWKNLK